MSKRHQDTIAIALLIVLSFLSTALWIFIGIVVGVSFAFAAFGG